MGLIQHEKNVWTSAIDNTTTLVVTHECYVDDDC